MPSISPTATALLDHMLLVDQNLQETPCPTDTQVNVPILKLRRLLQEAYPVASSTPEPTPTSPAVGQAGSGITLVAGGAAAVLLLALVGAVLYMWRRQCRLEEDLTKSKRKIEQHERAAARGFARRMSDKIAEIKAVRRASSTSTIHTSAQPPIPASTVSGNPVRHCSPNADSRVHALMTAPSPVYQGTTTEHRRCVTESASARQGSGNDPSYAPQCAGAAPSGTGSVLDTSPGAERPHIRRLGSTAFESRSAGPNFDELGICLGASAVGKASGTVSAQPDKVTGAPVTSHGAASSFPMPQMPNSTVQPLAPDGVTGAGGVQGVFDQGFVPINGAAAQGQLHWADTSKICSSFRTALTDETHINSSGASAFQRISQMTRQDTSTDGGSGGVKGRPPVGGAQMQTQLYTVHTFHTGVNFQYPEKLAAEHVKPHLPLIEEVSHTRNGQLLQVWFAVS